MCGLNAEWCLVSINCTRLIVVIPLCSEEEISFGYSYKYPNELHLFGQSGMLKGLQTGK